MNDIQVAWCYLNIVEDQREMQQMIYEFMDWYKWYVNPQMAKAMEERDQNAVSVDDENFMRMVADGLRAEGREEEDVQRILSNIKSN